MCSWSARPLACFLALDKRSGELSDLIHVLESAVGGLRYVYVAVYLKGYSERRSVAGEADGRFISTVTWKP